MLNESFIDNDAILNMAKHHKRRRMKGGNIEPVMDENGEIIGYKQTIPGYEEYKRNENEDELSKEVNKELESEIAPHKLFSNPEDQQEYKTIYDELKNDILILDEKIKNIDDEKIEMLDMPIMPEKPKKNKSTLVSEAEKNAEYETKKAEYETKKAEYKTKKAEYDATIKKIEKKNNLSLQLNNLKNKTLDNINNIRNTIGTKVFKKKDILGTEEFKKEGAPEQIDIVKQNETKYRNRIKQSLQNIHRERLLSVPGLLEPEFTTGFKPGATEEEKSTTIEVIDYYVSDIGNTYDELLKLKKQFEDDKGIVPKLRSGKENKYLNGIKELTEKLNGTEIVNLIYQPELMEDIYKKFLNDKHNILNYYNRLGDEPTDVLSFREMIFENVFNKNNIYTMNLVEKTLKDIATRVIGREVKDINDTFFERVFEDNVFKDIFYRASVSDKIYRNKKDKIKFITQLGNLIGSVFSFSADTTPFDCFGVSEKNGKDQPEFFAEIKWYTGSKILIDLLYLSEYCRIDYMSKYNNVYTNYYNSYNNISDPQIRNNFALASLVSIKGVNLPGVPMGGNKLPTHLFLTNSDGTKNIISLKDYITNSDGSYNRVNIQTLCHGTSNTPEMVVKFIENTHKTEKSMIIMNDSGKILFLPGEKYFGKSSNKFSDFINLLTSDSSTINNLLDYFDTTLIKPGVSLGSLTYEKSINKVSTRKTYKDSIIDFFNQLKVPSETIKISKLFVDLLYCIGLDGGIESFNMSYYYKNRKKNDANIIHPLNLFNITQSFYNHSEMLYGMKTTMPESRTDEESVILPICLMRTLKIPEKDIEVERTEKQTIKGVDQDVIIKEKHPSTREIPKTEVKKSNIPYRETETIGRKEIEGVRDSGKSELKIGKEHGILKPDYLGVNIKEEINEEEKSTLIYNILNDLGIPTKEYSNDTTLDSFETEEEKNKYINMLTDMFINSLKDGKLYDSYRYEPSKAESYIIASKGQERKLIKKIIENENKYSSVINVLFSKNQKLEFGDSKKGYDIGSLHKDKYYNDTSPSFTKYKTIISNKIRNNLSGQEYRNLIDQNPNLLNYILKYK